MARQTIALIGHPVAHSASPRFQNAALRALGLAEELEYVALDLEEAAVAPFVAAVRRGDYRGANVTVPYKELAAGLVDDLSTEAAAVGAVNTLAAVDGRVVGYNTDIVGFQRALAHHRPEAGQHPTIVLGAGGAARAVVWALATRRQNAPIVVVNRNQARAHRLVADIMSSGRAIGRIDVGSWRSAEMGITEAILINATSLGVGLDDHSPRFVEAEETWRAHWAFATKPIFAFDTVYARVGATPFCRAAEQLGIASADGTRMLLEQGAASLRIWTDRTAPMTAMAASLGVSGS